MDKIKIVILISIYLSILTIISIYLIRQIKKNRFMPAHNGIIVSIIFYYLIIPILTILNIDKLNTIEKKAGQYCSETFSRFIINGEWKNFIYSAIMILVTLSFFVLFYEISYKRMKNKKYSFDKEKTIRIVKKVMYVTFILGAISLIIFFASFGGITEALSKAESMRKMSSNLVEEIGIFALFKIIARLITVTPFLAIYLISETKGKNIENKIIFCISMLGSILFYLYNAGRAPIIMFGLCFLYMLICNKIKRPWTLIIILGVLSLPLLDILDSLFVFFNKGTFSLNFKGYINYIYQFSIPYKNTLILQDINNTFGLRFGKDFITGFLDFLPGISFDSAYVNLSDFIRGAEWKNLGGIPTDLITFSHMQLSFIGVILISGVLGYFLQVVDYKISLVENEKMKKMLGGIISVFSFSLITSADIAPILKGQFILIIFIIIIIISSKKEVKK